MSQDKKYREKGDIKEQYLYDKNPSNGSTKQNYVWNLFGTVSSSLISVVLLLFASRFLDSHNSDIFSIAYYVSGSNLEQKIAGPKHMPH